MLVEDERSRVEESEVEDEDCTGDEEEEDVPSLPSSSPDGLVLFAFPPRVAPFELPTQ